MKKSGKDRLKCAVYESTRALLRGLASPKGSQPRLAALGSPFQGKGLAWTLPPSYGRRCPEGAEVGWGKRDEKDRGEIVSSASFARAALSPYRQSEYMHVWKNNTPGKAFPAWGRWRAERAGWGSSGMKKSEEDRLKCAVNESTRALLCGPPSPQGEGGERSEPDRVLAA